MSVKIRILGSANRTMQRVGFLKLLCAQTARVETSNIDTVGKQFVQTLLKRVRLTPPYSGSLREYVRLRLTDRVYHDLRKAVLNNSATANAVSLEMQDLYLADSTLASTTGKLVDADWRRYPYLATALDFIKLGTYSIMTRALVLLAVTPKEEIAAFNTHDEGHNPLRISPEQASVLLYCFIDNDAEIIYRLFHTLIDLKDKSFDERTAGDFLPHIIRESANSFRNASLPVEDRERLGMLEKVAGSIADWKGKPYTGSGSREEFIRVRLEPYCDLGLFTKPDKHRFAYRVTPALRTLITNWHDLEATDDFLEQRFFTTLAGLHRLKARKAKDDEVKKALLDAGQTLKSTLGYSPITDVGLLAGIRLLFKQKRILELSWTRMFLRTWQKEEPNLVRFTVDRMGALTYVKFLQVPALSGGKKGL
jgi:hypothetical protein